MVVKKIVLQGFYYNFNLPKSNLLKEKKLGRKFFWCIYLDV